MNGEDRDYWGWINLDRGWNINENNVKKKIFILTMIHYNIRALDDRDKWGWKKLEMDEI